MPPFSASLRSASCAGKPFVNMTMAVLAEKPHCSRACLDSSSLTFAAVETMLIARRTSFSFVGFTSTMRLPYTFPRRIIAPVDSMLSTIFCAVPDLSRVEPVMTSGPGSTPIAMSAAAFICECLLQVTATVRAPISLA